MIGANKLKGIPYLKYEYNGRLWKFLRKAII